MGKTALVLSGGGAKGAFQVGAEKYLREEKGYSWDVIAGVSVGALNGTMLAMEKYGRLEAIWKTISSHAVYSGKFNLATLWKLYRGAKSIYSNDPLAAIVESEIEPEKIVKELRVGTVSLNSGRYTVTAVMIPISRERYSHLRSFPLYGRPSMCPRNAR